MSTMLRFVAILSQWCKAFMRTSVGRCPRKWSNECAERWQINRRSDTGFIGMIFHSLGCKKQKAPLDSQRIAIGSDWPWAGNVHLAREPKNWLGSSPDNPASGFSDSLD